MLSLYATIKIDTMLYFYLNINISLYKPESLSMLNNTMKSVESEDIAETYITNMHACMHACKNLMSYLKSVKMKN